MLDVMPYRALVAEPAPALPISRLIEGRTADEVVVRLPRLFNVCRTAQRAAVKAALGRSYDADSIKAEILRDHLIKFHATWPAFFGHPPSPLPDNWAVCGAELHLRAFGPSAAVPATAADFFAFLRSDHGYAPVLRLIDGCFQSGEAVADLKPVTRETIWSPGEHENSIAARVCNHPAMMGIANARGKGPLWRAAARLYDLAYLMKHHVPSVECPALGEAIVSTARGTYAVRVTCVDETVSRFERVTPTDHLLAAGGVLERNLATLPVTKVGLGPLLIDILDPCRPVRLKEARYA